MAIIARSPTRVDLAGGTLDIAPLTRILQHKTTVNFGITLDAQVSVAACGEGYHIKSLDQNLELVGTWADVMEDTRLPLFSKLLHCFWHKTLPALQIEVKAKSPAGAGLGGSSCLAIAFASALIRARSEIGLPINLSDSELVQTVQDVETAVIKVPTGCQDYWGGLRGGINLITYPLGGTSVETLRGQDAVALKDMLILCYSGVSRASGKNNWAIFNKAFEGDKTTLSILNEMGLIATNMAMAVREGAWKDVFKLSESEWNLRVKLWSDIETSETKAIAAAARSKGAMFSRICGAGGGGVMAVFAEPSAREDVCRALTAAGGKVLDGTVSLEGTVVKGSLYG
jgi:D-glycero-alpha-D-manno-heptose-7-phosphate kinase